MTEPLSTDERAELERLRVMRAALLAEIEESGHLTKDEARAVYALGDPPAGEGDYADAEFDVVDYH